MAVIEVEGRRLEPFSTNRSDQGLQERSSLLARSAQWCDAGDFATFTVNALILL